MIEKQTLLIVILAKMVNIKILLAKNVLVRLIILNLYLRLY